MFKKFLIPLDGSLLAEKAIPYALDLAYRLKAQLLFLRIVDPLERLNKNPQTNAAGYLKKIHREITERASQLKLNLEQVETLLYDGSLNNIPLIAQEQGADLIIMTTHGQGRLSKLLMGSCAMVVIQEADIPVLLLRTTEQESTQELYALLADYTQHGLGKSPLQFVVPLDGERETENVLEATRDLAKQTGAVIHLLGLVTSYTFSSLESTTSTENELDVREDFQTMEAYLHNVAGWVKQQEPAISVVEFVVMGNGVEPIVSYVERIGAAMIILPTRGRGRIGQFFRGSLAAQVLRQSNLPILMINTVRAIEEKLPLAKKIKTV